MADLHGGGGMVAQDFEEEEVWAMMQAREGSNLSNPKIRKNLSTSSAWRASRAIPRSATSSGAHHSSSAPLNIPDWSKILKKKPTKKNMWDDDDERDFDSLKIDDDGDGDGDGYDEMLPPHEYLARRRLATTQVASFSMCEGIGRTLKGRDLTNLRKAILTKTGFLE